MDMNGPYLRREGNLAHSSIHFLRWGHFQRDKVHHFKNTRKPTTEGHIKDAPSDWQFGYGLLQSVFLYLHPCASSVFPGRKFKELLVQHIVSIFWVSLYHNPDFMKHYFLSKEMWSTTSNIRNQFQICFHKHSVNNGNASLQKINRNVPCSRVYKSIQDANQEIPI